ncbi:hypothetical protein HYC85_017689 [Camellia sinensis]|uniref:COBRA C-terminal domain-containing protein n=1 Tax=Camellia sinensis TaxID=4442 RepID=A0A7J7GS48_CAMSI|nr:hypothetical protein HYC85_017689 [Camellia sinensis]
MVRINWHVSTNYRAGWTARITLFNWEEINFEDWFVVVQLKQKGSPGFQRAYSFNGTNTFFLQGLPGLTYLIGVTNGSNPKKDPRVPGKQQTTISFTKINIPSLKISLGDGFPSKVYFNEEQYQLPSRFLTENGNQRHVNLASTVSAILVTILVWTNRRR